MTESNENESYSKTINVQFDGLPLIKFVSIRMKDEKKASTIQRISVATLRRFFTLRADWKIFLSNVSCKKELNGDITIPQQVNDKTIEYDGASVPLPWLISFLTIGIIRPLGVLLTASIVHDFAYKFGYLTVNGEKVKIERDIADKLFKDITSTVTGLPIIGFIAWFFVRLGWIGVKYNGNKRTGKPPIIEIIVFLIILIVLGICFSLYPIPTVIIFIIIYLTFYWVTLNTLNSNDNGIKAPVTLNNEKRN